MLRRLLLVLLPGMTLSTWLIHSAGAQTGAPLSVDILIQEVWGSPTLDLPPGNQRPDLYAVIQLANQRLVTPTLTIPRINYRIAPNWTLSTPYTLDPLRQTHEIVADVRIFDADSDADDKVLLTALYFEPTLCRVRVGEQQFAGQWENNRQTCIVPVPQLTSEMGAVVLTLTAQWNTPE
ncbi:MAG TPA: hypothetical protein ACFE0H_07465 [Elainellaceae cyanobacterium]